MADSLAIAPVVPMPSLRPAGCYIFLRSLGLERWLALLPCGRRLRLAAIGLRLYDAASAQFHHLRQLLVELMQRLPSIIWSGLSAAFWDHTAPPHPTLAARHCSLLLSAPTPFVRARPRWHRGRGGCPPTSTAGHLQLHVARLGWVPWSLMAGPLVGHPAALVPGC